MAILRQVLLEGQAVSAVCEEHDLSPTLFYTWQKQFFENGVAAFAKDAGAEQRELVRTVEVLRERLGQKLQPITALSQLLEGAQETLAMAELVLLCHKTSASSRVVPAPAAGLGAEQHSREEPVQCGDRGRHMAFRPRRAA